VTVHTQTKSTNDKIKILYKAAFSLGVQQTWWREDVAYVRPVMDSAWADNQITTASLGLLQQLIDVLCKHKFIA